MKKVLVIVGPTAVGKTDFSLVLAKRFNGEIISGDSIQAYRAFDIGSGKIMDTKGVVHYGIDILDACEEYSVCDFQAYARKHIDMISDNDKLPMIVGGTGLYVKACLYDYEFGSWMERNDYSNYSNEQLYELLKGVDAKSAEAIHPNNRRRVERALDIAYSGEAKSDRENRQEHKMLYDAFIVGCTMDRELLYERINKRVGMMAKDGLKDELARLIDSGVSFDMQPMKGIGYRQWEAYFNNEASEEEVIMKISQASRNFAKRQYTWFNHQMPVNWVDMNDKQDIKRIIGEIESWLYGTVSKN